MLNMETLTAEDEQLWRALMGRLRSRRGELKDAFTSGFPTVERYGPDRVPIADVEEVVADSMEMFLRLLVGEPLDERLRTYPERLGTRRARQGIELNLLLEGVRWNFTVLWRAMREDLGDENPRLLVSKVSQLLSLVEQHIARVQRAYMEESARISRDSQYETDRALAAFLAIEDPTPEAVGTAAAALHADIGSAHWLALALAPRAHDLLAGSRWTHAVPWQNAAVLIAPGSEPEPALPEAAQRGVLTRHPVPLASLPRIVRTMVRLSVHLRSTDDGVACQDLLLREFHATATSRIGAELLVGPAFGELREVERERLLSTFAAYSETGSVSAASAAEGCHRNTVVSRMRRIRDLTGLDPYVPRDATVLALAWGLH